MRPTVENATKFLDALKEFGFAHELDAKELVEKDKVLTPASRSPTWR